MKKIKVLYEDSNILAVDKLSGILAHPAPEQARCGAGPDKKTGERTILDLFCKKYPGLEVAHRLDKETSGVMLLAKNQKAREFLKNQFKNREIKKTYHAIVSGFVKNDHGIINKPIGRSPKDFRRRLSGRGARGEMREAITEYRVLKRLTSPQPSPCKGEGEQFTYLEIKPKTGRTHQIRVHMKFLNHPVACDSLYNPGKPCPKGISRLALHAKSIEFNLPAGKAGNLKGETVKVESPLPAEFKKYYHNIKS